MSQKDTAKPTKPTTKAAPPQGKVDGEGSYTATRDYRDHLKTSPGAENSEELAQAAKEALDGPEGDELRKAEAAAKRGPGAAAKRPD